MSLVFNSAIKKKSILLDNILEDKYQDTNLSLQMFGGFTQLTSTNIPTLNGKPTTPKPTTHKPTTPKPTTPKPTTPKPTTHKPTTHKPPPPPFPEINPPVRLVLPIIPIVLGIIVFLFIAFAFFLFPKVMQSDYNEF